MPSTPRRPELSADDLRVLNAVARLGRLTAAADLLGIDHTTVRRRLDRLEAALGARLLDRGADGWQLTTLGREVVERSAALDDVLDQVQAIAEGDPAVRGTVRIAAPDGFGSLIIAPALAGVRSAHPGISIELVTSTRPLSLRGSGFDLAVTIGQTTGARVRAEALTDYALRLYASPAYLADRAPITSVTDLVGHELIFYVDALLTVHELDLAPVLGGMRAGFASTNVFAQYEAVRAGAGIGLVHAFMAEGDTTLVPVLPGEVEFRLRYTLSSRPESPAVGAVGIVRDALFRAVWERRAELLPGG